MDVHSKEVRSYNMSCIKGKGTKPEEMVRKYLFSQGFRYRKNDKKLPGTPDVVLPKYKTVIFVNGCFWHGHEGCKYFVWPKNNAEFWKSKILQNIELDKRTVAGLFGVPPFLVGVGNYSADEYNNFISSRIMPLAKGIEQEMTRKLLISPNWYIRFNYRSLYSYSIDQIVDAGSAMVDRMAMSRNEWRDWAGIAPRSDMEELLALENYIPVDRLGDQKKLKGGEGDA